MSFPKGHKLSGSRKGKPNKTTATVKEGILLCYQSIGGDDAFAKWAKKNPGEFYTKIWAKVLPIDINHGGKVNVGVGGIVDIMRKVFASGEAVSSPVPDSMDTGSREIQNGPEGTAGRMDNDDRT